MHIAKVGAIYRCNRFLHEYIQLAPQDRATEARELEKLADLDTLRRAREVGVRPYLLKQS